MHSNINPSHKVLLGYIPAMKDLWKSIIGSSGRFRFHIVLDEDSVSLRRETTSLYRTQLAFFIRPKEKTKGKTSMLMGDDMSIKAWEWDKDQNLKNIQVSARMRLFLLNL